MHTKSSGYLSKYKIKNLCIEVLYHKYIKSN